MKTLYLTVSLTHDDLRKLFSPELSVATENMSICDIVEEDEGIHITFEAVRPSNDD